MRVTEPGADQVTPGPPLPHSTQRLANPSSSPAHPPSHAQSPQHPSRLASSPSPIVFSPFALFSCGLVACVQRKDHGSLTAWVRKEASRLVSLCLSLRPPFWALHLGRKEGG